MTKIDTVSEEVQAMLSESKPTHDVYKGGRHLRGLSVSPSGIIRNNGQTTYISGTDRIDGYANGYLPQFPMESRDAYIARVQSSWLFNGVSKTVENLSGKLFERPVQVDVDEAPQIAELMANADLAGNDINALAMDAFDSAMLRGLSFLMVDAPRRPDGPITQGQAQAMNLRPFITVVKLPQVLGWTWQNINNVPKLTTFRIQEAAPKPDRSEWSNEMVDQIRALSLDEGGNVRVRLYQRPPKGNDWDLVDDYLTDQTEIMVTPVYTDKRGFFAAKTPLYDLTELNLAWFRSNSDQANIMHHARAPMKYFHGYNADEIRKLIESAGYAFTSSNTDAKVGVVEHGGQAIGAGRQELLDLQFQMQVMGLQMVISKTGNNTATGDAIDERKENSRLSIWSDHLKTALEQAIVWVAELAAINEMPVVIVNTEFSALNHLTMDQVRDMYAAGVISQMTYINEAKRRGVLDEGVDPLDEQERIEAEGLSDIPDVTGEDGNDD